MYVYVYVNYNISSYYLYLFSKFSIKMKHLIWNLILSYLTDAIINALVFICINLQRKFPFLWVDIGFFFFFFCVGLNNCSQNTIRSVFGTCLRRLWNLSNYYGERPLLIIINLYIYIYIYIYIFLVANISSCWLYLFSVFSIKKNVYSNFNFELFNLCNHRCARIH